MNWRPWVYGQLQATMTTLTLPPTSVFAGGALTEVPSVYPYMIYRVQGEQPRIKDDGQSVRSQQPLEVWVYDQTGSYDRIDAMLRAVRLLLTGPVSEVGAIACEWLSDGPELFDDELKALVKVGSYNLIGVS
jgi:hypothetical protein